MRKIFVIVLFLALATFSICKDRQYEITRTKLSENIFRIDIGTVVLLAVTSDEGVLLSDCGFIGSGKQLKSELEKISPLPVKYVINTHWHHDHAGGNFTFYDNATIISSQQTREILATNYTSEFWQETYEAFPDYALPEITFKDSIKLNFGCESIELKCFSIAHTRGDITVHFKEQNIIHVGDLLFTFGFPALDVEKGSTPERLVSALTFIFDFVDDETIIVPGHGPNFTKAELAEYIQMITETSNIVTNFYKKGMSMDEMKEKNIIQKFSKWGNGYFSTDDWIEIVYESIRGQEKGV